MKIGILGDGQLARMLIQEGQKNGLEVSAYSNNKHSPAAQVSSQVFSGDINEFCLSNDIVTFESEFIDLKSLTPESLGKVLPNYEVMKALKSRETQKSLLDDYSIPTSPWIDLKSQDLNHNDFSKESSWVLKQKQNGYDGYGTYFISDFKNWTAFKEKNDPKQFIAEKKINFKKEMAILYYRTKSGSIGQFPLVEWRAKDAKCYWVKGPYSHPALNRLSKKVSKMLKDKNYVGVLAAEFFDTGKDLLVNELAPRVHNSGHYSQNAMSMNQFLVHLLCLIDAKLPKQIKSDASGFAMVNLIGTTMQKPKLNHLNQSFLHWYGKSENRPGRKMGHLNAIARTPDEALKKALQDSKRMQL